MKKLNPKFKLWLSNDNAEGVFGDGKWRLLKAIDRHGSLSAAAKALGISYRKAWGDIKKAEKYLGVALVEKRHGGKSGGSASLTSDGKKWSRGYTKLRSTIERAVSRANDEFLGSIE